MRHHRLAGLAILVLLAALKLLLLTGCPLDPAKVPPCTGREAWPDPCAAGARDAGGDR